MSTTPTQREEPGRPAQATAQAIPDAPVASAEDLELLEALRRGDEAAFAGLVDRFHAPMLRLAMSYVSSRAVAEEAVQDAWLAIIQGLDRFEGRSSLKTWIFRIVSNRARSRAVREHRSIPFSTLAGPDTSTPSVEPERFLPDDHRWAGHWASPPQSWEDIPEERLLAAETRGQVEQAIQALPASQRLVVTLRDVEGWTGPEVCDLLGLTMGNQRVLLHRARARIRHALERYFDEARWHGELLGV